ncbi:MAG: DegV family protein, partial [Nevskiales bacterium]
MRIGIVTDATCDLPAEFIQGNDIEILPVTVRLGEKVFIDQREFATSMSFYEGGWGDQFHDAETSPFTVEEIHDVFLQKLVKKFDYVFCVTVWKERSKIFENATRASFAILRDYRKVRAEADIKGPFAMRVIDSGSFGAGVGLVVAEIARLIKEGVPHDAIRRQADIIVKNATVLLAIDDLAVMRARTTKRGEKSVGFGAFLLASALDIKPIMRRYHDVNEPIGRVLGIEKCCERMFEIACEQIYHRITSSCVTVSYGGNPKDIEHFDGYKKLKEVCALKGVELLTAVSSMSFSVNVGQGALSIAWGTDEWK